MEACSEPGRPVYLSRHHDDPKRRLKYTWEIIDMPTSLVGVNTLVPNKLVKMAIQEGVVPELTGYDTIRPEVKYGAHSRIDLLLERNGKQCFVEIKNCTLVIGGTAYFPDAVTARGRKHLVDLQQEVRRGNRAVMFYLVQRMDAAAFRPADHIDPDYGLNLRKAAEKGVEILVYDVRINLKGIRLNRLLPYHL
jgi:sugar fermentation stimulation protein A